MRMGMSNNSEPSSRPCHLIDWNCCTLKVVTRSTFTSELQACIAATDAALAICLSLEEIAQGPMKPEVAMKARETGGLTTKISVKIDAMSIISALSVERPKAPAESSLLVHLLWLKQLVDNNVLNELAWVDTRDMSADGHTKGSIDRRQLLDLCRGVLTQVHPSKAVKKSKLAFVCAAV